MTVLNQQHAKIQTQNLINNNVQNIQSIDPQEVYYRFLDPNESKISEQIEAAINLQIYYENDLIPFVSPTGFNEWEENTKLFLLGASGCGKSRSMYEIVQCKLSSFRKIIIINPHNPNKKEHLPLSKLIHEIKENELLLWDNFPDGLDNGQIIERGREALAKVTSGFVNNFIITLKPKYLGPYQDIINQMTAEFTTKEITYDQDKILEILDKFGNCLSEFRSLYSGHIVKKKKEISRIIHRRERTPEAVQLYLKSSLVQKSKGFFNPVSFAEDFLLPRDYYNSLFKSIINTKGSENKADFLFSMRLAYDLKIPRTYQKLEDLQLKIFGSIPPSNPTTDLSTWIYLSSAQYSMNDEAKNSIEYPESKRGSILNYLSSPEFLGKFNSYSDYLSFGLFYGKNIQYFQSGTDYLLPRAIYDLMNKEVNFKSGLTSGLGGNFSLIDDEIQNKVWNLAEKDNAFKDYLFSSFGRNFTSYSTDLQQKIWEIADYTNKNMQLGIGLGFAFHSLNQIAIDRVWQKIDNDVKFALSLALGIGVNFPYLTAATKMKIWKIAEDNPEILLKLGMGIGGNFPFFNSEMQEELKKKIMNNPWSLMGFSMTVGVNIESLIKDKQEQIEQLISDPKLAPLYVIGLAGALQIASPEYQEKIWARALQSPDSTSAFAASLGSGFRLMDKRLQLKIWQKAEENTEFALGLASGLGTTYFLLPNDMQEKIWKKVNEDNDFATAFAISSGRTFSFASKVNQEQLWKKVMSNESFAIYFATFLGTNYHSIPENYKKVIWRKVEEDKNFAQSFGQSLGASFPYSETKLGNLVLNKVQIISNDLGLGFSIGISSVFPTLDKNTKNTLTKNASLSEYLGFGFGANFPFFDNNTQDEILLLAENHGKYLSLMQEGLNFYFSDIDLDENTNPRIWQVAESNKSFASILAKSLSENYPLFSEEIENDMWKEISRNEIFGVEFGRAIQNKFKDLNSDDQIKILAKKGEIPNLAKGMDE